jgi:hypothetical protein
MKKNSENILQQIQKDLLAERYDCTLELANEKIPNDQLIVFIGNDASDREKILLITAVEQIMQGEESKAPEPYYLVHFHVVLSFAVAPLAASQTGSTLLFINRLLELPGFELSEIEEKVNYRYVLFMHGAHVDKLLLFSIIGNIMMTLDLFGSIIESVAIGQKTFNDLLEEMLTVTK